ncbi:MAG: hypothetical protein KDA24_27005 [Deltaproteobacteria bacterium]|nr:hypothetical protein [Deltaproteobacteria bacterium]
MSRRRSRSRSRSRDRTPAPRTALAAPVLDASLPPDVPLRPEEQRAMKRHLRFIKTHRRALGVRLNAEEDLLVNGAREPEHRGVALALLSKIDHPTITKALDRVEDPKARTDLLAGVVRFSDDLGILLLYVESLADSESRRKAAGAFSLAVARMDLSEASPARVERLLAVLTEVFAGHERAQALFGLLHAPGFSEVFDSVRDHLPPDLKEVIVPLAAVHEEIVLGQETRHGHGALKKGCALLLAAPADVLSAYPREVRVRLLESAVALVADDRAADRAASALIESLPKDSDDFVRLSLLRAGELLRLHADERAKWLLRRLEGARAQCNEAALWRDALDSPQLGRFAIGWPSANGRRLEVPKEPDRKGFVPAFSLDAQTPVWLRTAGPKQAQSFAAEVKLHRGLVLGGVAPVLGATLKGKHLSVAVPSRGVPAKIGLERLLGDRRFALDLATQAVGALGGLAHAGVRLPDARRWRFLVEGDATPPRLWLADLSGARESDPLEARKAHGGLARGFAREVLSAHESMLPPALRRLLLRRRPRLEELAAALADALR